MYEKNASFNSFGRKCEDCFIRFWIFSPGNVALLFVLVRIIVAGPLKLISTPLFPLNEGEFILSY